MYYVEGERDKYKGLARRLKEERNQFKEMLEAKNNEQAELQVIEIRLTSFKKTAELVMMRRKTMRTTMLVDSDNDEFTT